MRYRRLSLRPPDTAYHCPKLCFFAFAENFAFGGALLFLDGVISEFKL
jgi:hypothetical protein